MTGFGLMALWVRCNRVAMELEQTRQRRPSAKSAEQNGNLVASPVRSNAPSVIGLRHGRRRCIVSDNVVSLYD